MVEEYLNGQKDHSSYFCVQPTMKGFRGRIDCYANVSLSGTSLVAKRRCKTGFVGLRYAPRSAFSVLLRGANRFTDRRDTRDCNSNKFAVAACLESEAMAHNLIKYYTTDAN